MKNIVMCLALGVCAFICMSVCTGCGFEISRSGIQYIKYSDTSDYTVGSCELKKGEVDKIEVDWVSGSVSVEKSDDGSITASENESGLTEAQKMRWKLDDHTLKIRFCESGYTGMINGKKSLTLQIPDGIDVDFDTVSAAVNMAEHSLDKVEIQTISGKLHAAGITADSIKIETTSGEVEIEDILVKDKTKIETISGKVNLGKARSPEIKINTTSGSINIGLSECKTCNIETTSGKTTLTELDDLKADIHFNSISGDLEGTKSENGNCDVHVSSVSGDLYIH